MSSDRNGNTVATSLVQRIRNDFVMRKIYVNLFNLFNSNDFLSRTENVKCALILIRNMSLAGILSADVRTKSHPTFKAFQLFEHSNGFVCGTTQTALASDPQTRKAACLVLFECDILPTLNGIKMVKQTRSDGKLVF